MVRPAGAGGVGWRPEGLPVEIPVRREVAERVDRLELPFNRLGYDPYGISRHHLKVFLQLLWWLYHDYLEVRAFGIQNVPPRGRAMVVGNHSGGIALDAGMILASLVFEMEPPRLAQGMAEFFLARTPFASIWTSRVGQLTGLPEHARMLLEDDRLLMVFPEGARGTAKLYPQRHSLVRFGTGFMRLALQTGTPIIPTAFIGGGEAIPTFWNSRLLGRMLGAPYYPITPWGVPWPRPTHCEIYYGRPIRFDGTGDETDEEIQARVDQVKERIASLIALGVQRRREGDFSPLERFPGDLQEPAP